MRFGTKRKNLSFRRDEQSFCIRFNQRDGSTVVAGDAVNGVDGRDAVEDIAAALEEFYPKLIQPAIGWEGWQADEVREVAIRDLGPGRYGLAATDARAAPYIVLSPRAFDVTSQAIRHRRRLTAIHELVHLLQFETNLFMFWHRPTRIRSRDPNWWFHEATALALEWWLLPEYPSAFPRLWEWAAFPEVAIDSDPDGFLAFPFVVYLMDRYHSSFPAKCYDTIDDNARNMRAAEVISRRLEAEHPNDPGPMKNAFLDYCVAMAPLSYNPNRLAEKIAEVVGYRAITARFHYYPILNAVVEPIEHLGCRYFRFDPPKEEKAIEISIRLIGDGGRIETEQLAGDYRGKIIVTDRNGRITEQIELLPKANQLIAEVPEFGVNRHANAILVLANCAYSAGWATSEGKAIRISATEN